MEILFTTLAALGLAAFTTLMLLALAAVSGRPLVSRRSDDDGRMPRADRTDHRPKPG